MRQLINTSMAELALVSCHTASLAELLRLVETYLTLSPPLSETEGEWDGKS
jgi:hypothetical protein